MSVGAARPDGAGSTATTPTVDAPHASPADLAPATATAVAATTAGPGPPPGRRRGRRPPAVAAGAAVAALAPWAWFAVRDVAPLLDLVAIALPVAVAGLVAAVVLAAFLLRRAVLVVPLLSVLGFGVVAIVVPWSPRPTAPPRQPLSVVSANVAGPEDGAAADAVAATLVAADADVVVVAELSPAVDQRLRLAFPFHAETFAPTEADPVPPAVGVFSRTPISDVAVRPGGLPGLRVVLDSPSGPVVLYALHAPKAWLQTSDWGTTFGGHQHVIEDVAAAAGAEVLPVVVAGDLNTPDRSQGYRTLTAHLTDAARADWTGPTSVKDSTLWRLLALRVDHVLVSPSWCSDRARHLALPGSDHRAVAVDVGPCPR